jgi:hypothetical protein
VGIKGSLPYARRNRNQLNINNMQKLTFGRGNAKLSKDIYTFSLPAGFTCPGAHLCAAYANKETGKITDGKQMIFRCFAASAEATYPNVRASRWHNYETLKPYAKDANKMAEIILNSLDKTASKVRIHVSGDFFTSQYFAAWCYVANARPQTIFYAYTKSLKFVAENASIIPFNFILTLSEGGKYDYLMSKLKMKVAKVVLSEEDAEILGLEIDHDDSHAFTGDRSFALLIHGMQKSGSAAAAAIKKLKANGTRFSYSK